MKYRLNLSATYLVLLFLIILQPQFVCAAATAYNEEQDSLYRSSDGTVYVFESDKALLPSDTNGYTDVYAKNITTGKISMVSNYQGKPLTNPSRINFDDERVNIISNPISADGRYCYFINQDDGGYVLLRKDITNDITEIASIDNINGINTPTRLLDDLRVVTTSADGRYVLFAINGGPKWILRDMQTQINKTLTVHSTTRIDFLLSGDGNSIIVIGAGVTSMKAFSIFKTVDFSDSPASLLDIDMNGTLNGSVVSINNKNNIYSIHRGVALNSHADKMLVNGANFLALVNLNNGVANFITSTSYGPITSDQIPRSMTDTEISPFSISDDGNFIVFYNKDSGCHLVNTQTSQVISLDFGTQPGSSSLSVPFPIAITPDGKKIIASGKVLLNPFISNINATPATISFDQTDIATPSISQTITVTNNGASSATLGAVTLGGNDSGFFSKVSDGCSGKTLSAGTSCTVGVNFTPTVIGTKSAILTINDASQKSVASVALSGTGVVSADDHGGDMATATVVTDNSQTAGKIQNQLYPSSYDEDVFKFTATSNGIYTIYTTGALDTYGQVCDATGQACDYDDDSGTYPNFLLRKNMAAGEVAYVGVASQLTSGNYTLHIDPPPMPLAPSGLYIFTPIYPSVATNPSTVMQGGKVKRIYKVSRNILGSLFPATNEQFDYRMCTKTILGTLDCAYQARAASSSDGYISFETDWIKDPPGTVKEHFVEFVNPDGTPSTLVNSVPLSFNIEVYPRSLQQEFGWSEGLNYGGIAEDGVEIGVAGASGWKTGIHVGAEWGSTIKLDSNEFGTSYSSKTDKFSDVTPLSLNLGVSPSLAVNVEGPGMNVIGQKIQMSGSGEVKDFVRINRNDKFPDFFSNDPLKQNSVTEQAYGYAARVLQTQILGVSSSMLLNEMVHYLYQKSGDYKDFRDEASYSFGVSGKLDIGPSLKLSILKDNVLDNVMQLAGFSGEIMYSNTVANSIDQIRSKNEIKLSHSLDVRLLNINLGKVFGRLDNFPKTTLFGSVPVGFKFGTGGNIINEIGYKNGSVDNIKLTMTTSMIKADTGILLGSVIAEKSVSAYTTNPEFAKDLYNNGIGVKTLCASKLLNCLFGPFSMTPGLAGGDLLAILDSKNAAGSWGYGSGSLEFYNSYTVNNFSDFSFQFDIAEGVGLSAGVKNGNIETISQIESKGVSVPEGNFETEEYQLDDQYVSSKRKSFIDIFAVYGKLIKEAINAVTTKVEGYIADGEIILGNLVDGGVVAKKTGATFNWLSNKVYLTTTKAVQSGLQVKILQSPPASGMSAKTVALAAATASTIGQNHFVNIQNSNGLDLITFPAPITISIGYKLADLTAAGLTAADASKLKIYRWDDTYGIWVYVGGIVNTAAQSVTVDITGKGSFILAIDTIAPVISDFKPSDSTPTPTLTATIKDSLSGINTNTVHLMTTI